MIMLFSPVKENIQYLSSIQIESSVLLENLYYDVEKFLKNIKEVRIEYENIGIPL